MIKKIKKYGTTQVITFSKKEMELYNLKLGDLVDISDIVKIEKVIPNYANLNHKNKANGKTKTRA